MTKMKKKTYILLQYIFTIAQIENLIERVEIVERLDIRRDSARSEDKWTPERKCTKCFMLRLSASILIVSEPRRETRRESFLSQSYEKTDQYHNSWNIDLSYVIHRKKVIILRCRIDILVTDLKIVVSKFHKDFFISSEVIAFF